MKDLRATIRDTLESCSSRALDDEVDRAVVEQKLFLALAAMFGEAVAIVERAKANAVNKGATSDRNKKTDD